LSKTRKDLTQKYLKSILDYDSTTGIFLWKETRSQRARIGDQAGTVDKYGYNVINIDGYPRRAHRLAWLYVKGHWPNGDIDHINQSKYDNRIDNLRDVDHAVNGRNQLINKNNTSGFAGVCWNKKSKKWEASIMVNYKTMHLGRFTNKEDAINARKQANIKHNFHPNHGTKKVGV